MTQQRRIELTEFVNDNLARECAPELIDDIVDLIETQARQYTRHIAEQAVGGERPGRPDNHIPDESARVSIHVQEELAERILTRINELTQGE